MRTTVTLDDDVLQAAKSLAQARAISLGAVISELARKGLQYESLTVEDDGFPVFKVSPDARPLTLEDVKRIEDDV